MRNPQWKLCIAFVISLFFCCHLVCPDPLWSQGTSATVSGTITDVSGAQLPAATVTFINSDTGVVRSTTTNGEGLYRIPGLPPGLYRATVEMTGFKQTVKEGITLHLEDQISLNYSLTVGATSETVTINADANVIESSSPTVSQVIEGRQVEDTPLNGRNTMNLVALTPGVVPQGATSGAASNNTGKGAFTNSFGFGNYSIAGGQANQGSVYLDGVSINGLEGHTTTFVVQQDAVQEFRVETSVVSPQYGEFSGGIISFATKSGANELHGSLYEYFRNTIFNANDFFLNNGAQPRQQYNQNQYGATAGGAIKKDKAFYFVSYEGFRQAQGVPNSGRVPTPAEVQGNFTADAPIVNPTPFGNAAGTVAYASGVAYYRQVQCRGVLNQFCLTAASANPGDAVVDPTAYYLANNLHYFPTPNVPNPTASVNFIQSGKAAANNNSYVLRFDTNVGSKQKLLVRYARLDRVQKGTQYLNNPGGPNSQTSVGATAQDYVVADTITLNPTTVIDLRASYLRYFSYLQPVNTTNLAALGPFWAGVSNQLQPFFPDISITNLPTEPYTGLNMYGQQPLNSYTYAGTYSRVIGRHSLSVGGEFRVREEYFDNVAFTTGLFVFAGTNTSCVPSAIKICPFLSIPGTGATPQADFISGRFTVNPAGFNTLRPPSTLNHYGGLFVNDTFQLLPKLTITAGLRYELPGGLTEKNGNNTVLLPQLANPLVAVNSAAYSSSSDLQTHLTLFSPRVGFSFQTGPATTVRAGYSLVYIPMDADIVASPAFNSVNEPSTFVAPGGSLSAPLGFVAGTTTPKTTILQPIGRGYASNPTYFYGQSIAAREPFSHFPYLQQWNANVQQQFGSSLVTQLAYLGARGEHLPVAPTIDINQLPDQYDGLPAAALSAALRPYPQYQNVNQTSPFVGDSYYHSLQATLTKRLKGGGTFLANYSWSKFLGTADSLNSIVELHNQGLIQDFNNLRAERSYESFDLPQRLVVSYIIDLPIGKGRRYLGSSGGLVDSLVGGWSAGGINTFQSGFPLAFSQSTGNLLTTVYGAGTLRPNVVTGCNKRVGFNLATAARNGSAVVNASCFTVLATTSTGFGNEPRTDGSIRSEGVDNWDFSLGKKTSIVEGIDLIFRAEAFNVTNRVQFGDPNPNVAAGAAFGTLTQQVNAPRSFQFSLRANY